MARTGCSTSPDPMASPIDWVWAYLAKTDKPPSWWLELWSLSPGQLSDALVQELAKKQAAGFTLPAAKDDKVGCWNVPPCMNSLVWWNVIPECKFQFTMDVQEVRREQTVALPKVLQGCVEWLGSSSQYNMWHSLRPVEMPCAPHTAEVALLLSEDPEPQRAQASTPHFPIQP